MPCQGVSNKLISPSSQGLRNAVQLRGLISDTEFRMLNPDNYRDEVKTSEFDIQYSLFDIFNNVNGGPCDATRHGRT